MVLLDSYLARKTAVLAARRADYETKPESSLISIKASSQVAGITGARPVRIGDHTVLTDSAPGLAGHSLGPTAPELLLGSLASWIWPGWLACRMSSHRACRILPTSRVSNRRRRRKTSNECTAPPRKPARC